MSVFVEIKKGEEYIPVPAVTQEPGQFPRSIRNFSKDGTHEEYFAYCLPDNSATLIKKAPTLKEGEKLTNAEIVKYMSDKRRKEGLIIFLNEEKRSDEIKVVTSRNSDGIILRFTHVGDQKAVNGFNFLLQNLNKRFFNNS